MKKKENETSLISMPKKIVWHFVCNDWYAFFTETYFI